MLDPALQQKVHLSEEDWKLIKAHPGNASTFLKDLEFPFDVMAIITSHHERWDGQGYPAGLVREAIPFGARVLAVVDAFQAMTHGRAYKASMTVEAALAEIEAGAGHQFDPKLVAAFAQLLSQKELSAPVPADKG
jgi:putative two-component system response regulator